MEVHFLSYQLSISDDAYSTIKLLIENRLVAMKQNISAYVERVIQFEGILEELEKAEHIKDPKPQSLKPKQAKAKAIAFNLCPEHKMYGAKKRPRTDCETCWKAYEKLNGRDATNRARRDFNRTMRIGKTS